MKNLQETFTYDDMNRLTGITLKRSSGQDLHCGVSYDALGRMTSKQAVTAVNGTPQVSSVFSQPAFDATKIHAINSAQSMSDLFLATAQTVTYTGFNKADKIKQGNDSICYTYGYDHQRIFMEEHFSNTVRTKHYVGMCEYVTEANGTKSWTYLTGPYGVFAVIEKQNGVQTPHYVLKDNLGSWNTITDGDGTVEQRLSYDAWGNLRNPDTWANYTADDSFDKPMFERGYTGHEHLTAFGLVNMNGRMYDPVMSSFLSADRYVQDPTSAMGFNRYAYCMYNPLRFVDPTGWRAGSGHGSSPDDPPPYVVFEGWASGYLLDEVTVTATPLFYDEFVYTPYYNGGGGSDQQWSMVNNSQPTIQGAGGGGGNHGGNTNNTTSNQNINIDIASKMLIVANLYTSIESKSYFNLITKKWKDKLDIIRDFDFHGNQYTGGKNSFGKMMSQKFNNAGRVFGSLGVLLVWTYNYYPDD